MTERLPTPNSVGIMNCRSRNQGDCSIFHRWDSGPARHRFARSANAASAAHLLERRERNGQLAGGNSPISRPPLRLEADHDGAIVSFGAADNNRSTAPASSRDTHTDSLSDFDVVVQQDSDSVPRLVDKLTGVPRAVDVDGCRFPSGRRQTSTASVVTTSRCTSRGVVIVFGFVTRHDFTPIAQTTAFTAAWRSHVTW